MDLSPKDRLLEIILFATGLKRIGVAVGKRNDRVFWAKEVRSSSPRFVLLFNIRVYSGLPFNLTMEGMQLACSCSAAMSFRHYLNLLEMLEVISEVNLL